VRPVHLGTMQRQQQPCSDDPVGTLQPDGTGTRLLLIRDFRARAESCPGREAARLDDIPGLNESLLKPLRSSRGIGAELSKAQRIVAPCSVRCSTMMAEWGLAQANRTTVPFTLMGVVVSNTPTE